MNKMNIRNEHAAPLPNLIPTSEMNQPSQIGNLPGRPIIHLISTLHKRHGTSHCFSWRGEATQDKGDGC